MVYCVGFVYCDVKFGNIFVEYRLEGEWVYVCDFGFVRYVSLVGSFIGDCGFVGMVDYVAFE